MSDLVKMQFELTRTNLFKTIEEASEEILDVQPKGYKNTIHWNIGHILTTAEKFLFGPNGKFPAEYNELFGYGSKPADWKGNVPTVATLLEQLKEQLPRIKEIPEERFQEKLPEPILGRNTYGELAALALYHETFHYGQIYAMKRFLQ